MIAGQLEIQLMANIARLQRDMDSARSVVGGAMSSIERSVGMAKNAFGLMAGAFAAFGASKFFSSVLDEQEQFQRNLLRTEALLKSNGHAAGLSSQELRKNAQELALATLQSVEGVERAQQILLTFTNVTGDTFLRATEAAADLATVTGGDLNGSMTMLGKALNDPVAGITAMTRAGVSFSEQQKETIKKLTESNKLYDAQKLILDELARQYGGVSKAEATGFAGAMDTLAQRTQEAKIALGDYLKMGTKGADIVNWWAEQVNKFTAALTSGIVPIGALSGAFVTAAKVAASYFAIFVAAPVVYTAVTAAAMRLVGAVATYTMNVLIGQAATIGFNTALFGTSVSAQLASGSLSKLALAGNVLFAAFAGWQIGSYLRDEFEIVRVAGLAFVGALMKGGENLKYNLEIAFEAISFAWDKSIATMKTAYAGYLSVVAKGLSFVGPNDAAKGAEDYAAALRLSAGEQKTFAERTASMTAEHDKAIAAIDENIVGLIQFEQATAKVVAAEKIAKTVKTDAIALTDEQKAAMKKEADAYTTLITAIRSKIAENKLEMALGANATESQKMSIKLDQELASGKLKLSVAHQASARAALVDLAASEQLLKMQGAEKDVLNWIIQSTQARIASKDSLDLEYAMYGKSADAHDIAKVAIAAEADMQKFLTAQRAAGKPVTDEMEAQLRREADLRVSVEQATLAQSKALAYAAQLAAENKKYAADSISDPQQRGAALLQIDTDVWQERIRLAGEGTAAQKLLQSEYATWYANQSKQTLTAVDVTRAKDLLDIMAALDDATKAAASGMSASFGKIGSAIGGLTTALSGYGRTQAAIAAQLAAATKDAGGDQSKIQRANAVAAQQSAQAQIRSYGDMASAAKGFFKENTTGYKVLEGTEKAFRAYEMAMAIKSMATSLFATATKTTAVVAGQGIETAAVGAGEASRNLLKIPGVFMSFMSSMGPWGAAAAGVAIAAVLGGAFSGGGSGGTSAADMQKKQGTGGVFGDDSAKTDSIKRSLEMLESNSGSLIPINRGMLSALRSIEASMKGLTNLLVRSPGVVDGSNMGIATGTLSKTTGNGLTDAIQGVLNKIPLIGGVLGSTLGKLASLFGKTTQNIVDAGIQFGGSVSDLQSGKGYNQYASVDTTKSSWFGLSKKTSNSIQTQGLNEELSAQFGLVFTGLEGALTAAAVGLGVGADHVKRTLDALTIDVTSISLKGLTGTALTDALNAVLSKAMDQMSAAVFPELDSFRQVGEGYTETVVRLASNYAKVDAALSSLGMTFGAAGISSLAARERLIALAGGIDKLTEQASGFANNFLTEAERLAPVQKYVTEELGRMGLAGVETREQFKKVVLGLNVSTEKGAEMYSGLMALQEAFADVVPAIEATGNAVKTASAILDERKNLQQQYDALTMTSTQLLEQQRMQLDESNRALFDSIQVAQLAKDAEDKLTASRRSMQDQIDALTKASLPLIEQRGMEIAALGNTLLPLQMQIYAMQDQAAAASAAAAALSAAAVQRSGLEKELLQLQGDTVALRALELDAIDPANKALKQQIFDLQDKQKADAEAARLAEQYAADQRQAAQEFQRASDQIKSAWQSVTSTIFDEVARIRGLLGEDGQTSLAGVQAAFAINTAKARAGDQDAAKLLPGLSKSLLDLAEANALTSLDLRRYQAQTSGSLTDTARILSAQFGLSLPSFAVGSNLIPSDMIAQLHEGERVIPKADNQRIEMALAGGGNADLLEEVRGLRTQVSELIRSNGSIEGSTKKSADTIERVTEGGDAMRTREQAAVAA